MRIMVALPNDSADLRDAYADENPRRITELIARFFGVDFEPLQVVARPSFGFGRAEFVEGIQPDREAGPQPGEEAIKAALPRLLLAVRVDSDERALEYIRAFRAQGIAAGAAPAIERLSHWTPGRDRPAIFNTRAAAAALINAAALSDRGLSGRRTNLVMFDEGVSFGALRALSPRPLRLAGGWSVFDGTTWRVWGQARPDGHGTMVALNAVSLAPDTRLWDLPMLPERILDPVEFAEEAAAALLWVETWVRVWLARAFPGPWVFCHAWGVYDRRLEHPSNTYTGDPLNPLNLVVKWLDEEGRDQVFGAGNGGQFQPHPLCGPGDIGPGRSILGANSSLHALTMGAVRADGMWIGYSSQGPGQAAFGGEGCELVEKPDLCAPSHFVESTDSAWLSSGTSAACGVAAGAVAALRSVGSPLAGVGPENLRDTLRQAARKPPGMWAGLGYDIRHGHGILDLAGVLTLAEGGTLPAAPVAEAPVTPASAAQAPEPPVFSFWRRLYERLRNRLRGSRLE